MATRTLKRYRLHRMPYQAAAAAAVALAITFAAGAASVSAFPGPGTEPAQSDLPPIEVSPFEYFPGKYQNQATEVEPMPPTF